MWRIRKNLLREHIQLLCWIMHALQAACRSLSSLVMLWMFHLRRRQQGGENTEPTNATQSSTGEYGSRDEQRKLKQPPQCGGDRSDPDTDTASRKRDKKKESEVFQVQFCRCREETRRDASACHEAANHHRGGSLTATYSGINGLLQMHSGFITCQCSFSGFLPAEAVQPSMWEYVTAASKMETFQGIIIKTSSVQKN